MRLRFIKIAISIQEKGKIAVSSRVLSTKAKRTDGRSGASTTQSVCKHFYLESFSWYLKFIHALDFTGAINFLTVKLSTFSFRQKMLRFQDLVVPIW